MLAFGLMTLYPLVVNVAFQSEISDKTQEEAALPLLTIYITKVIGLYCIIVSLALSVNKRSAIATVNDWMKSPSLMMFTGVITLTIGLALVIGHNVWSGGALPVTVTVLGWLTLIKGLTFLALPPAKAESFYEALRYEGLFFVYMGVTFVLGLYLTISAFSA